MKFDKHHIDKLMEVINDGGGRVRACKVADISYQTFMTWIRDPQKTEFLETLQKAEDCGNNRIKDLAKSAVISKFDTQWQSAAWWLERKHHSEFGKRQEVGLHSTDPIKIEFVNREDFDKTNTSS